MAAFLGISLWIALATVIPGLVTIAAFYGAFSATGSVACQTLVADLKGLSEWVYAGIAITIMVLTQAVGILLERLLVRRQWLGPPRRKIEIPEGIDPCGQTKFTLEPYAEYRGVYLLLAELREKEDSQGHLQRALAQFFLTNNTIVSFTAGICATAWGTLVPECSRRSMGLLYGVLMFVCLLVSFAVARIRFEVMAKALWAARRRWIKEGRTSRQAQEGTT